MKGGSKLVKVWNVSCTLMFRGSLSTEAELLLEHLVELAFSVYL
jgi:hypothetical protein